MSRNNMLGHSDKAHLSLVKIKEWSSCRHGCLSTKVQILLFSHPPSPLPNLNLSFVHIYSFFTPLFSPLKMGWILCCFSHLTLTYVEKIKDSADKNNLWCDTNRSHARLTKTMFRLFLSVGLFCRDWQSHTQNFDSSCILSRIIAVIVKIRL